MKIIGISEGGSCSAVFLENGEVQFAIEEERFSRKKGGANMGIPCRAIEYGLKHLGWSVSDVDAVCLSNLQLMTFTNEDFYRTYKDQFESSTKLRLKETFKKSIKSMLPQSVIEEIQKRKAVQIPEEKLSEMGFDVQKIHRYHHHLCHAAAAYYGVRANSEEPHIVISLDGGGDGDCSHVYLAEKENMKLLDSTPYGHSPGNIYSCTTHFMGMKPHEHEYKLMGISAYAKKEHTQEIINQFKQYVAVHPDNPFKFQRKIPESLSRIGSRLFNDFKCVRFDNMAGGLQLFTEELLLDWVSGIVKKTGIKKVVAGGGVFMNIKTNKRIAEELGLEHFDVMPSCGDESNAFGAAWYHYAHHSPTKGIDIAFPSYCLGSDGADELTRAKAHYRDQLIFETVEKPNQKTAELLAEGKIIARCSDQMEFGARALGNRSILADPTNASVIPIINKMIKNRDFWMPFAPAIKKERAQDYLIIPESLPETISPFMMHAFDTTDKRADLYAGTHAYDQTARAEIVTEKSNKGFYEVINEFEKITGRGAVLNTSFNLHGYPIVRSAMDACDVLVNSGLEYLIINDCLITKKSS